MYEGPEQHAFHPLVLSNCTGMGLYYWISSSPSLLCPNGEEVPLLIDHWDIQGGERGGERGKKEGSLGIQLEGKGLLPVKELPTNRAGAYSVCITPETKEALYMVYEVAFRKVWRW